MQLMVRPASSGVLFTVDPRAVEQAATMLVEAVHGLGEGLVSGEITPHSASVDLHNRRVRHNNAVAWAPGVRTCARGCARWDVASGTIQYGGAAVRTGDRGARAGIAAAWTMHHASA